MIKGTVDWYDPFRGYGFIKSEDGNNIFVHHTAFPKEMQLYKDDAVEFDTEETDKGIKAVKVKKV